MVLAFILGFFLQGEPEPTKIEPTLSSTTDFESKPPPLIWTCAMHPQIRLPKPGKCPICFMDLIPVESSDENETALADRQLKMNETAVALAEIQTSPVIRKFPIKEISMFGKVTYDETRLAYITTRFPGRLDHLYLNYTGAEVKKGQVMAEIYSPELITAQQELIKAAQIQSTVEYDAEVPLYADSTSNKSNYTHLSDARALEAAREKLKLLGLEKEQIQDLENTKEIKDLFKILAPLSGTVIEKDALEGMYVDTGSKIYTIADLSQIWAQLEAYESDLFWLKGGSTAGNKGQQVEITTEAYPQELFSGKISFINPVLDENTRTVSIRVVLPNPGQKLKPGMFVKAKVKVALTEDLIQVHNEDHSPTSETMGEASQVKFEHQSAPLLIPSSAPLITGKRAVVYVKVPDTEQPTFEGREIHLGPRAGDYYIVHSGLSEGEEVVTKGNFKIDSAMQIQAKPSMMNPEPIMPAVLPPTSKTSGADIPLSSSHKH